MNDIIKKENNTNIDKSKNENIAIRDNTSGVNEIIETCKKNGVSKIRFNVAKDKDIQIRVGVQAGKVNCGFDTKFNNKGQQDFDIEFK